MLPMIFLSGCFDLDTSKEDEDKSNTGDSAFDRKKKLKELELTVETLTWENSRLSLKLKTVDGGSLVMDKVSGLWHYDVERVPFSGRASEVFPDGSPRGEADFFKGKKDGMERFWWPNGKLKENGQWFDGRAHGVFQKWNEEGNLIEVIRYKNGELIEVILEKN
jgi:antitoxin component YwqK of YwqJK toxin-antitoxin module